VGRRSKRKRVKKILARQERRWHNKKHFKQPGYFKDNYGNDLMPFELVFPILRLKEDGDFQTVGTGFFVHPAGGFVTAKHCLYNNNVYDDKCYAVHSITANYHEIRKIRYFEAHPIADIGMGMLKGQIRRRDDGELVLKASFPVSLVHIEIGEKISTIAYPRMKISSGKIGTFRCDKFEGKIVEYLPDGSASVKDECYQTNMLVKSGASGGPVLRGNQIIGVNSSSISVAIHEEPISFITPIIKILDLTLKDSMGKTTTVKELISKGYMPGIQ
jgi:hypothetical protein